MIPMKNKIYKHGGRELPFECQVGYESETVSNPFSGNEAELQPDALAVYDVIKGAESMGLHGTVRKGLSWFIKYYPKEYSILLD